MQFFFQSERKDKSETSDHTFSMINQTIVEYSFHGKGINTLHSKQMALNTYYFGIFFLILGELLHFFSHILAIFTFLDNGLDRIVLSWFTFSGTIHFFGVVTKHRRAVYWYICSMIDYILQNSQIIIQNSGKTQIFIQ